MNYCIYGNESYLLKQKLDEIIKENDPDGSGLNTVIIDAQSPDFSIFSVLDEAWMIPFLAEKKTVVLRNPSFLSTQGSLNDKETAALDQYLKQSCPSTDLVFYCEMENLDQRKKLVKQIRKTCRCFELKQLNEWEFQSYVNKALSQHQLILSKDAMKELMDRLPLNLEIFHQELEKLLLYGKKITAEDVIHLVSRPLDEDVFHLVNAVTQHDLKKAMHLWRDLDVLNKDPIYLVTLLSYQFRLMAQVKMLSERRMSESMMAQMLKVHPFRVKKAKEAVSRMTTERCLELLNDLADLDQSFKKGTLDRKLSFELFLIKASK